MPFPEQYRTVLLDTAWQSIERGLADGSPLRVKLDDYDEPLSEPGASFVTLHRQGELRGCIGSLEAYRPLIIDVAENGFAAAFRDPRFAPLKARELRELTLDISLLSHPEAIPFDTEQDLLNRIRPHVDGLILRDGVHRGTFLPSVWESLPDRVQFLNQLKLKAGLAPDYWSDAVEVWRYTTESFGDTYG